LTHIAKMQIPDILWAKDWNYLTEAV